MTLPLSAPAAFKASIYAAPTLMDGVPIGAHRYLCEVYPFAYGLPSSIVTSKGGTTLTNDKVIGSYVQAGDPTGKMTMRDYNSRNIAWALSGVESTLAVAETTLTAEPVTLGSAIGDYTAIGTEDIADGFIVQDSTDTTTYVSGVDYRILQSFGQIAPLTEALAGVEVHITATGQANTDQRVTIGAGQVSLVNLMIDAVNKFTGQTVKHRYPVGRISFDGEVVLTSEPGTEQETLEFSYVPMLATGATDYGSIDGLPVG